MVHLCLLVVPMIILQSDGNGNIEADDNEGREDEGKDGSIHVEAKIGSILWWDAVECGFGGLRGSPAAEPWLFQVHR